VPGTPFTQQQFRDQFDRAIADGNVALAWTVATRLDPVPLDRALLLTVLLGPTEQHRFRPAAARFLARFVTEATPSLAQVSKVADALDTLGKVGGLPAMSEGATRALEDLARQLRNLRSRRRPVDWSSAPCVRSRALRESRRLTSLAHSPERPRMNRLRSKLTYSNVMVTVLAFVVLAGGTAYAASEMLPKNSVGTKQIAKEAVTPAKLSKASKATLTGPAGPTGATGPQGAKGDTGAPGKEGTAGKNLTAETPLSSGQTETGVFSASATYPSYPVAVAVFVQPLPAALDASHVFDLAVGETNSHCSGPGHAAPGYFCAYDTTDINAAHNSVEDAELGEYGANKDGAEVFYTATATGAAYAYGTWAVTAP
jgi:hypothetical protein